MDVVRGCMFGLCIMGISRIHQLYGWLIALHLGNVLIALPFMLLVFAPGVNMAKGWTKNLHTKLLVGIVISTLGSIAFGISQGVFITGFLMMASIRNVKDLRVLIWSYSLGTGVLVFMSLFIFQVKIEGSMERLSGQASWDANDIGLLMCTGLPLVLLCFQSSGKLGKLVSGTIAIGTAATIAITGSRGAFLGMGALVLAFLFTLRGVGVLSRIVTVVALVGGLVFSAPEGYWHQMETIGDTQEDYNTFARQGRKQLAIRGMEYMMDHPMFGLGIGQFGRAEGTLTSFAQAWNPEQAGIKWSAAHNSYVQAGAELGVPGFLMYIAFVGGCIVIPFRLRKKVPHTWAKGDWEQRFLYQCVSFYPLAAIGYATASGFVSFAFNDPIYFLGTMCGALYMCVNRKAAEVRSMGNELAPQYNSSPRYARGGRGRFNRPVQPVYASSRSPFAT